jgi:UDP-glucose 4-epimerase
VSGGTRSVLITGAAGYIGRKLVRALAESPSPPRAIVATDVREVPERERVAGVVYGVADVRGPELERLIREHGVDTVVHLAAIVTPGPRSSADFEYSVDVEGTRNVLETCIRTGVRQLVVTSSGAAYGYHADNPPRLAEDDPLRGNDDFPYSRHKRLVEEMLARYRRDHPELRQLVFRPGPVLGAGVANQIVDLFEKPVILGIAGTQSPFAFVWDRDVVACLRKGIEEEREGVYNLAADGTLPLADIARRVGRPYIPLPAGLLGAACAVLHPLGLTQYEPAQVNFLRYRPVLANDKLKREFGYTPLLDSDAVFERYWNARTEKGSPLAGKAVIVTGAASGIGAALARRFGRAGAKLGLLDRDAPGLERLAAELREAGRAVSSAVCDVTDAAGSRRAIEDLAADLGAIDVLINNVGITHLSRFADTDVEVLRRVVDVNLFGAIHCTKAALPHLVARRGAIVVVSSIAGLAPLAARTGYAASKHALHGLFDSLRAELRDEGVRVLVVCPGFTRTSIGRNALGADGHPFAGERTVAGREWEPERVADAICRGLVRGRRLVVLSAVGKLSVFLTRFLPAFYERLMTRRMAG